jgi:hypothetical protein
MKGIERGEGGGERERKREGGREKMTNGHIDLDKMPKWNPKKFPMDFLAAFSQRRRLFFP